MFGRLFLFGQPRKSINTEENCVFGRGRASYNSLPHQFLLPIQYFQSLASIQRISSCLALSDSTATAMTTIGPILPNRTGKVSTLGTLLQSLRKRRPMASGPILPNRTVKEFTLRVSRETLSTLPQSPRAGEGR
jgi:hypothetical protein